MLTELMQINESGLKIFSIDDLQGAAEKSVQFSKLVKLGMMISLQMRLPR